ncbi:MAG TPA: tetratricopeptide repeat protein [Mesorhizobium sp.]|nr:tetratricopeptide repeat protein [Mesorhizobium sp.]
MTRMPSPSTFFVLAGLLLVAGCASGTAGLEGSRALAPTSGALDKSHRDVGKAQFRGGNYGLAEKHFRKATELKPDDAEAWMGLAAAYDRLGRFDLADRAYQELLKKAGRRPEVVNNMGYSQLLRGDKEKARQLLAEAKAGMTDTKLVDANLKLLGG